MSGTDPVPGSLDAARTSARATLISIGLRSVIFADQRLSRRLERAEARGGTGFIEARVRLFPDCGAEWTEIAGAYAMYDGPDSPVTQTFGLGLFEVPTEADLGRLETFFESRKASVFHEVSPLADKSLVRLLGARGYRPVSFTSVMYAPLDSHQAIPEARNGAVGVRLVGPSERELWARTAAEGWREFPELSGMLSELMLVTTAREDAVLFLAEVDGQPAAAAALCIHGGVGLLAGASTIPEMRNRGAQRALLHARLRYAANSGCDLAMMCAEPPGEASQRNAERQGFRVAYTRVKWGLLGL